LLERKELNKIRITYNKNVLHPIDPFLTGEIAEVAKVKTIPLNNDVITVHCHKLPYPDKLTKEQLNRAQLEDGSTLLETQAFMFIGIKGLLIMGPGLVWLQRRIRQSFHGFR
jgi:hypothetical protein